MTDLLEHTEWVFQNGLLSSIPLEQAAENPTLQLPYIHRAAPHFAWQIHEGMQSAYQIQLASAPHLLASGQPDMWDSGQVESSINSGIAYAGKPLQPATCYYWQVRVWDEQGHCTPFSAVKKFHTAPTFSTTTPRYPLVKEADYPQSIARMSNGYFIDFGKATFGQIQVTLTSHGEADTVSIHLGEAQQNCTVARKPGGTVRYTCYRLPLQRGRHTYQLRINPDGRNTNPAANESGVRPILMPQYIGEVYPFRYCEISHYTGPLHTQDVVRHSVNYPFNRAEAQFLSSDTVLNQVWELCKHSIQTTTFCGVYVDGDRERIPYEADAYINQLSHYATDRDLSMARYSVDYLMEWPTWPTEWIMQSVLMLWNDYLHTADTTLLRRHYPSLTARTLSALQDSTGLISTKTGRQTPEFLRSIGFRGKAIRDIVDWPQSGALGIGKDEAGEADGYDLRPYNTVVNAYHYRTLVLMEQIARVAGDEAAAESYAKEAKAFGRTFNRLLFDAQRGCYRDGVGSAHHSLHASMFALAFGLVPQAQMERVCQHIQSRGMACSVYGAQFLLDALFDAGMDEYALSLLCGTGLRSWYNMIRVGSTVTLEAWDAKFKPNLDWNHAWGAAPANQIARYVVGVQPIEPGYKMMRIRPHAGHLTQVEATVPTIQGSVCVKYSHSPGQRFSLHTTIPANTQAEIWLPRMGSGKHVVLNGQQVRAQVQGAHLVLTVGPGTHQLTSEN